MKILTLLSEDGTLTKKSSKFPGKFHLGGGYYSSKEGGPAEFKSEKGRLKVLTPKEKATHIRKTQQKLNTTAPSNHTTPATTPPPAQSLPSAPPPGVKAVSPQVSTPPEKKSSASISKKIKDGIKNWSDKEKDFFKHHLHKGNSPERRGFTEALKHKLKGTLIAVKHGMQHEGHTFKEAGSGVKNFLSKKPVSPEQKKALINVGVKVITTAATGGILGHAAHGLGAFGVHVMEAYIPHIITETLLVGAAKAAIHAGAEEENEDALIEKFMNIVINKLQTQDIPAEVLASAIESWNKDKPVDSTGTKELNMEMFKVELKTALNDSEYINNVIKKELCRLKK